jgi:hypothetical protein
MRDCGVDDAAAGSALYWTSTENLMTASRVLAAGEPRQKASKGLVKPSAGRSELPHQVDAMDFSGPPKYLVHTCLRKVLIQILIVMIKNVSSRRLSRNTDTKKGSRGAS